MFPQISQTIGNHEFDDGIDGLVPFLETIKTRILISNIDDSLEPTFQNKYTKSIVITKYERPIGIVGVTTTMRSNWGKVNILPEIAAVRDEVARLTAEGIKIIIVLSHCGLEVDREIAQHAGPVDIIVGGHSHTFLFSGENPPGPDRPQDTYPTVEKNEEGQDVLIVQASAYTKYLGDITLYFDDDGIVQNFEGAPIFLSNDVVQDPEIVELLKPWKAIVDPVQNRHIGDSKFDIPSDRCYVRECLMGSLSADAYASAVSCQTLIDSISRSFFFQFLNIKPDSDNDSWTGATISLANPGGLRAGLTNGEIVFGDVITTTPFENFLHSIELQGKVIREALEFSVGNEDNLGLLQVSGIKVTYDMKKSTNNRIVSLLVLCRVCEVPRYEPIDNEKFYRVVVPSFLAGGGDDFSMIREGARNLIIGPLDIDALTDHITKNSPINTPFLTGRITFV